MTKAFIVVASIASVSHQFSKVKTDIVVIPPMTYPFTIVQQL